MVSLPNLLELDMGILDDADESPLNELNSGLGILDDA